MDLTPLEAVWLLIASVVINHTTTERKAHIAEIREK